MAIIELSFSISYFFDKTINMSIFAVVDALCVICRTIQTWPSLHPLTPALCPSIMMQRRRTGLGQSPHQRSVVFNNYCSMRTKCVGPHQRSVVLIYCCNMRTKCQSPHQRSVVLNNCYSMRTKCQGPHQMSMIWHCCCNMRNECLGPHHRP